MMSSPLAGARPQFRAVVTTVVPEAKSLDGPSWQELEQIVERALEERSGSVQRQVRAFLRLLNVIAFVTHARTFTQLDDARRLALLDRLGKSPLLLVRRGVWGVRTLALMGYYARPSAAVEIGYRATAAGWMARPHPGSRAHESTR
jgi:hypothetical protein